MSYSVLINFQDGSGWVDLTQYETAGGQTLNLVRANGFQRQRILHNRLRPVSDKLVCTIEHNRALANKLLNATTNVLIVVTRDEAAYFTGYFRPTVGLTIRKPSTDSLIEDDVIEIEALDNSWKLDRSHGWDDQSDILLTSPKVCNPAQPANSIVHVLLTQAGYTETERSQITEDIDVTLNSFTVYANRYPTADDDKRQRGTQYRATLEKLLYEYGYLYYFDEAGRFRLYRWAEPTLTPTATVDHSDMADELGIEQNDDDVDKIDVEYNETRTMPDATLASRSLGGNELNANALIVGGVQHFQTEASTVLRIYNVRWQVTGQVWGFM